MAWSIPKMYGEIPKIPVGNPLLFGSADSVPSDSPSHQLSSISPSPKGLMPSVKYWFKSLTNLDGTAFS